MLPAGSASTVSTNAAVPDATAAPTLPGTMLFSVSVPLGNAARSASIAVDAKPAQTIDISASGHDCSASANALRCTLSLPIGAGAHTFDFSTYAAAHAAGTALSTTAKIPFTVVPEGGKLGIAIAGTPASVALVAPQSDSHVVTRSDGGYDVYGNSALAFQVFAKDAEGRYILGKSAPQVSLTGSGAVTVSRRPDDANAFVVTSNAASPDVVSGALSARLSDASSVNVAESTANLQLSQPWIFVAGGGTVRAFDEDGNAKTLSGSFAGLLMPYGITYVPDNRTLYVVDVVAETVRAYDLQGQPRTIAGTFPGLHSADSISYDPRSHLLFVSQAGSSTILRCFDTEGRPQAVPASLTELQHAQSLAFRTKKSSAVAVKGDNSLLLHDASGTRQTQATATADRDRPAAVALDERDDTTYVSDSRRGTIVAIDARGNERARSSKGRFRPHAVAFDVYARRVYAADATATYSIAAFDETLHPIRLAATGFKSVETPHALAIAAR